MFFFQNPNVGPNALPLSFGTHSAPLNPVLFIWFRQPVIEEPQAGFCAKATTCAVLLSALQYEALEVESEDESEEESEEESEDPPVPLSSLSRPDSASAPAARAPSASVPPLMCGAGAH